MAFIDDDLMADKMDEVGVKPHPLLAQAGLSASVKATYLQGCVLAALMDDAQVDRDERHKLRVLGLSLGLLGPDIDEFIQTVQDLKTREDKDGFIDELKKTIRGYPLVECFMVDFEELVKKDGGVPESVRKSLDFIGAQLLGRLDWRQAIEERESARRRQAEDERRRREQEAERRRQAEEARRRAEAERAAQRKKDEIREQIKKKREEYDSLNEVAKALYSVDQNATSRVVRERNKVEREIADLEKQLDEGRPGNRTGFSGLMSILSQTFKT